MPLTRLDCHIYRGPKASLDHSAYTAINPNSQPGSLVVGLSSVLRGGLGSQVACKLSLEHYLESVLNFFGENQRVDQTSVEGEQLILRLSDRDELSLRALETAFKNANKGVYDFGHKLAAGGKLAASLLGVVIINSTVATARVGNGSVYLYRGEELFPFFVEKDGGSALPLLAEAAIGSNSLVNVELASVDVEPGDSLIVISERISKAEELAISQDLSNKVFSFANPAQFIAKKLFPAVDNLAMVMCIKFGAEAIYLGEPI